MTDAVLAGFAKGASPFSPAAVNTSASSCSLTPMLISAWSAAEAQTKVDGLVALAVALGLPQADRLAVLAADDDALATDDYLTEQPLRKIPTISVPRFDARFRRQSE